MLLRRLFHTTDRSTARLVGTSLSVSPDFARAPPPEPPTRRSVSPPRPPPSPASTELRPIRRKGPAQTVSPEVAHKPVASAESLASRLQNRVAQRSTGEAQDVEKTQRADEVQTAADLDVFLLRTLSQLADVGPESGGRASLHELAKERREKAHAVVEGAVLEYEPTPSLTRRVRLDGRAGLVEEGRTLVDEGEGQDGTVVVAHVLGGKDSRVSICSGFAVGKVDAEDGAMILTCAHTLDEMERYLTSEAASTPSATFILTSSGHAYTVDSLLSALPSSDLLLLRLSPQPVNPSSLPIRPLRSLPINPYPSPSGTGVSVHRYLNPLGRLKRKLQKKPEREWEEGRIVEYKDSAGRTAETGSYDELACMWMSATPTPGSSGGPVVCRETGSVVGVTRGSSHTYGERQQYGFATPAEKILEMFAIPGFQTTAQRLAEREASSATKPAETAVASTATDELRTGGRTVK
ncbi:hypothetical protein JCM10213_001207 [Rhodosporidiobolus nylandii]